MKLVKNKLRIYHYPQVPCKPFFVDVKNEYEAYKIINTLADQHLFLYNNGFIPDYSNAITVVMYEKDCDGEGNPGWGDYWNDEESCEWYEIEQLIQEENENSI